MLEGELRPEMAAGLGFIKYPGGSPQGVAGLETVHLPRYYSLIFHVDPAFLCLLCPPHHVAAPWCHLSAAVEGSPLEAHSCLTCFNGAHSPPDFRDPAPPQRLGSPLQLGPPFRTSLLNCMSPSRQSLPQKQVQEGYLFLPTV